VAVNGLALIDDPRSLPILLEAMGDRREKIRAAAARALGQCPPDPRAMPKLVAALADPDPWVRYYACQSLGRLRHADATPAITPLLADPAGQVRVAAVEALSHLPTDIAFHALREAAESSEPDVKRAALLGLGLARRAESLPVLVDAVDNGEPATRLVAVSALRDFPDRDVISVWARAARDHDEAVRNAAIANLSNRESSASTRALIDLLGWPVSDTVTLNALTVPVAGRVATILASLRRADDELSPKLTSVLARMRRPDATDALLDAFQLGSPACRKAAAAALAAVGSPDGLRAIRRAAVDDADPQMKQICALLLSE
jgi:HEAT repeat protein